MTLESGRLSQDIGPFLVAEGMSAAVAEAALPPHVAEALFNIDLDRNGRAVGRPGSFFQARLGEGAILGLGEHIFEFGNEERKLVAVVDRAYPTVNLLDVADDGVAGGAVAFCPNVLNHGQVLYPILANDEDRFVFQSFLNKLYFAGSTVDHGVYQFDYSTTVLKRLTGIKGISVAAQGNRLFVAGDPIAPNLVYPSDPDDPETFNTSLAFQIGNRTDGIRKLMAHEGLLVVLGERSCSWALVGAVELGDVQVETFTNQYGVVGPLAADEGGDGFIYFIAPNEGFVRWRRGMASPDNKFAEDIYELFRTVESRIYDLSGAVARWDAAAQAMRFEIPTANLLFSYFPRKDAWTFGASTENPRAMDLREYLEFEGALGEDRYTALASYRDPLDGNDKLYGGDADGHVWVWEKLRPDKLRTLQPGYEGTDFQSIIRWGNTEIAPVGYRGVIEQLLLDFLGGYNYEFTIYSDLDYQGFSSVKVVSLATDGGVLPLLLGDTEDESRLLSHRLHPQHIRVARWKKLIGKVVRLQAGWTGSLYHIAFVGLEMERSIEPHARRQIQSPPVPPAAQSGFLDGDEYGGPGDGGGTPDDSGDTTDPHDPPGPAPTPIPDVFPAGSETGRVLAFVSVDTNPPDPLAGDNLTVVQTKTDAAVSPQNVVMHAIASKDGKSVWTFGGVGGWYFQHWDLTGGLSPAAYDYSYSIQADALAQGYAIVASNINVEPFYSDAKDRLYVFFGPSYGTGSGAGLYLIVYDVSVRTAAPVKLASFGPIATHTGNWRPQGVECDDNEEYFWVGDSRENTPASGAYVQIIQAVHLAPDLSALTAHGRVNAFPSQLTRAVAGSGRMAGMSLRRSTGNTLLATLFDQGYIAAVDISDPANPSLLDEIKPYAGSQTRGVTVNDDGTRAYILDRANATNTGAAFHVIDTTVPTALSVLHTETLSAGTQEWNEGILYVKHETEPYLLVLAPSAIKTYNVDNDVAPVLIDSVAINGTAAYTFGAPDGPRTAQTAPGADPTPVDANVALVSGNMGGPKGVTLVVGLDDYTAPSLDAFVQDAALYQQHGPAIQFTPSGRYAVMFSGKSGNLQVWSLGGSFGKVYDADHSELKGCDGLVRGLDAEVWTYRYDRRAVKIDLTTPASPTISVTDLTLSTLLAPTGLDAEAVARQGNNVVKVQQGFGLFTVDPVRAGECVPAELWRSRVVAVDATYAYVYNELSTAGGASLLRGGIAVVNHTTDSMQLVGYEHWGDIGQAVHGILKSGNFLYLWGHTLKSIIVVDVSTPASPTRVATFNLGFKVANCQMNGANELVAFESYAYNARIARINVTVPAAPVLTESFATGVTGTIIGAVVNGKAAIVCEDGTLRTYTLAGITAQGSLAAFGTMTGTFTAQGFTVGGVDYAAFNTENPSYSEQARVRVVNLGTIAAPAVSGSTGYTISRAEQMVIDPATAKGVVSRRIVSGGNQGYYTIDLTTPASPVLYGPFTGEIEERLPLGFGVLGSVCCFGSDDGGLARVNLSTISAPTLVRWVGDNHLATQHGSRIYILPIRGGTNGIGVAIFPSFRVYGVSLDADQPRVDIGHTELSATPIYASPYSAAVSDDGTRLFFGWRDGTNWKLSCYDVSSVSAVTELGSVSFGDADVRAVKVSGTSLKVAVLTGGLRAKPKFWMYDFTTEAAPVKLGSLELNDDTTMTFSRLELF